MKYCSIDIETTGLDPERNETLSIGCVIEDTTKKLPFDEIPKFYGVILRHQITGSPRAITMNKELIEQICAYNEGTPEVKKMMEQKYGKIFYQEDDIIQNLFYFLYKNGFGYPLDISQTVKIEEGHTLPIMGGRTKPVTINVAGKNFGTFDKPFLEKLPWFKKLITVRQRILDPSILCVDWVNDETLPSLNECKTRMGIEGVVTHNALEDAWDVIEVLRKNY